MADTLVGTHVVYHALDGNDYEAVITEDKGYGVAALDVGKFGQLDEVPEEAGYTGDNSFSSTSIPGTFSYKPLAPLSDDEAQVKLVKDAKAGTVQVERAELNTRPPDGGEAPVEELPPPEQAVRDDAIAATNEPNPGDEGLDTPANYQTDQHDEQGSPLPPPEVS